MPVSLLTDRGQSVTDRSLAASRPNRRPARERGWQKSCGFLGKSAGMKTDVAGIPRGRAAGNPAWTETVYAGTTRGRFRNFGDDKNSGARAIRYRANCPINETFHLAAKYVVDS